MEKRLDVNRRFRMLWRLLGKYSKLSLADKLLVYKTIVRPIWIYGLERIAANVHRLQVCRSKMLRVIVNAPFYVSHHTLHKDLTLPFAADLARFRYSTFPASLASLPNPLFWALSSHTLPHNPPRRLKRWLPLEIFLLSITDIEPMIQPFSSIKKDLIFWNISSYFHNFH